MVYILNTTAPLVSAGSHSLPNDEGPPPPIQDLQWQIIDSPPYAQQRIGWFDRIKGYNFYDMSDKY